MRCLSLVVVLALFACADVARGDTLFAYDGFNYANNQTVSNATSLGGDTGWSGNWAELNLQPTGVKISNTNLPAVGFLSRTGLTLKASGTTTPQIWRNLATGYNGSTVGAGNTTLWVSFLLRKDADGPFANSDFAAVYLNNLGISVNTAGKYALEDVRTSGSTGSVQSSVTATVGESVLLIASINFDDTDVNGTNEVIRLYLATNANPNPVSAIAVKSNFDVGTITNVGVLFGYQAGWTFDELRMGDSLASVTPTPEPSILGLPILATAALLRRRRRRLASPAAVEVH